MCNLGKNRNWLANEAVQDVHEEEIWNSLTSPAIFWLHNFSIFKVLCMGDSRMSLSFVMRWKTQTAKVIETGFSQRRENFRLRRSRCRQCVRLLVVQHARSIMHVKLSETDLPIASVQSSELLLMSFSFYLGQCNDDEQCRLFFIVELNRITHSQAEHSTAP